MKPTSCRKLVSDDWYPCYSDGTVMVRLSTLTNGLHRVCVWGADDYGLELDYINLEDAQALYKKLTNLNYLSKKICIQLGMQLA